MCQFILKVSESSSSLQPSQYAPKEFNVAFIIVENWEAARALGSGQVPLGESMKQ